MRRLTTTAFALAVAWAASNAVADRCIGPKDQTTAVGYGVPLLSADDMIWTFCDDFDTYCNTNFGTGNPISSYWPGYPPSTPNVCASGDTANSTFLKNEWSRPVCVPATGSPANGDPSQVMANSGWKGDGWDGNSGWASSPYVLMYQGISGGSSTTTNYYQTFFMAGQHGTGPSAIDHKFPAPNGGGINGTDDHPLIVRWWTWADLDGAPVYWPLYVELRWTDPASPGAVNDHAPTDWVWSSKCSNSTDKFPMVCQQLPHGTVQPTPPTGCPALSNTIHQSLAFGTLAQLSDNPCYDAIEGYDPGGTGNHKPEMDHAVTFDGKYWRPLKVHVGLTSPNAFTNQTGAFNYNSGQAFWQMTVKTTTYELMLIAPGQNDSGGTSLLTSTAVAPRQYLGAFNAISIGAAPGCRLDPSTGVCAVAGESDYWRYMKSGKEAPGKGWPNAYLDRLAVIGGVPRAGACFQPDQNGTCSIVSPDACTGQYQGDGTICTGACCEPKGVCADTLPNACPAQNFKGLGTSCSTPGICPCPIPFADADMNGYVDMADFAVLQRCLTIGESQPTISTECACFDKNGDGAIDGIDVQKFVLCGTGSSVQWTPTTDCPN